MLLLVTTVWTWVAARCAMLAKCDAKRLVVEEKSAALLLLSGGSPPLTDDDPDHKEEGAAVVGPKGEEGEPKELLFVWLLLLFKKSSCNGCHGAEAPPALGSFGWDGDEASGLRVVIVVFVCAFNPKSSSSSSSSSLSMAKLAVPSRIPSSVVVVVSSAANDSINVSASRRASANGSIAVATC